MKIEEQRQEIKARRAKNLEAFFRLGKQLLKQKKSVFLELEMSHEDKKAVLFELGYSDEMLYK